MNYIYLGDRCTDERWRGKKCKAVLNDRGKCIRDRLGKMLVEFDNGARIPVIARRLRKNQEANHGA